MAPGRCLQHGWDWFDLSCQTKQDTRPRKSLWTQNSKGPSQSCSFVNMTCTNKLKPMMFTNIYVHDALEGGCQHIMWWWFANQTTWMKSYVFESWMMSLNVHFKSQKQMVFLIMKIYAPHSFKHVGRGELFGFNPCSWTILPWYSCHLMLHVVQSLDQAIIAFYKVQYKKKPWNGFFHKSIPLLFTMTWGKQSLILGKFLCGALECEDWWIPKLYETSRGCPRIYLETRVLI